MERDLALVNAARSAIREQEQINAFALLCHPLAAERLSCAWVSPNHALLCAIFATDDPILAALSCIRRLREVLLVSVQLPAVVRLI